MGGLITFLIGLAVGYFFGDVIVGFIRSVLAE